MERLVRLRVLRDRLQQVVREVLDQLRLSRSQHDGGPAGRRGVQEVASHEFCGQIFSRRVRVRDGMRRIVPSSIMSIVHQSAIDATARRATLRSVSL